MVGTWKVLSKASPGSGTEFGADDTDKINKLLRGDLDVDTAEINSLFRFRDGKLLIRDSLNLTHYIVRTSGIVGIKNITLPNLVADDTFVFNDHQATLTNKLLAGSRITNYLDVESTSTPINPGANVLRLYRRTTDNALVYRNNTGTETVLGGAGGGGGEANSASNIGAGGIGLFKSKVGVDLQFKKLNGATAGQIAVVDDTANNEVDLKITPSSIDGQHLMTMDGNVEWGTTGTLLPDGSSTTVKKYGTFLGGGADGNGMFAGLTREGIIGSNTGTFRSSTTWTTDATDLDLAGFATPLRAFRKSFTPRVRIEVCPINTSTERFFTGFLDISPWPGGSNPLANRSGVLIGYNETDTNWMVRWNNGGASPQSVSTGIVKDSSNFDISEILLDQTSNSISAWYKGALIVNANTTQVPADTITMAFYAMAEQVGAGGTAVGTGCTWAWLTSNST